jgi:hypothetical protein
VGEPHLIASGGGGRRGSPGSGRVDGLAVGVEPGTEFAEWSLLEVGDVAGAVRADVDEQVAAVGDDVGEQVDERVPVRVSAVVSWALYPKDLPRPRVSSQGVVGAGSGVAYSWVWTS